MRTHTHTHTKVIVLNVLLLYHVYQASEQAETTRASFKQNGGLMVSSVDSLLASLIEEIFIDWKTSFLNVNAIQLSSTVEQRR